MKASISDSSNIGLWHVLWCVEWDYFFVTRFLLFEALRKLSSVSYSSSLRWYFEIIFFKKSSTVLNVSSVGWSLHLLKVVIDHDSTYIVSLSCNGCVPLIEMELIVISWSSRGSNLDQIKWLMLLHDKKSVIFNLDGVLIGVLAGVDGIVFSL